MRTARGCERRERPAQPGSLLIHSIVLLAIAGVAFVSPAAAQPSFEDQVVEIVNQERWTNGQLPPLKRQSALDAASEGHSSAMAVRNFFAHCDLDTHTQPWDRMEAAGYTSWSYASENIAAGYSTPTAVMAGWMQSSGHRANILSTNVREIGVGYFTQSPDQANVRLDGGNCTAGQTAGPYTRYWTQDFGRRSIVYPVVIEREAYETSTRGVDLYVYGSGWANEMRFRNETGTWSAWESYQTAKAWTLSPGNGTKTVNAELRSGSTVRSSQDIIVLSGTTGVPGDDEPPTAFRMHPASPNPFRSQTRFSVDLIEGGRVEVAVFDVQGRRVSQLLDGALPVGRHDLTWDGRDAWGTPVSRGVYLIRARTPREQATQRVVLK